MPTLPDYLAERRQIIEGVLQSRLPAATPEQPFESAICHAVLSGGKRIRPILALAAADAISSYTPETISAACAIELLHTYTLVHDDLPAMDNDTTRRGHPTVWAKYGEGLAILVGDMLQSMAFNELGDITTNLREILHHFTQATRGVIDGQVLDIQAAKQSPTQWTTDLADAIFHHKTADLFIAAMTCGALTVNPTEPQLQAIRAYGYHIGFAFQIIDDLLDADEAEDSPEFSCLALMTANDARQWAQDHTQAAIDVLDCLPNDTTLLRELAQSLLARVL